MSIHVSEIASNDTANLLINHRFIHAPSSRAKLSITRKMLLTTTTYHQIMPSFLDLVFTFGAQHHAKDFFFTRFRHDTRLSALEKSIAFPPLGRSGRTLRLCYSLRSVEASPDQEKWPWSIRGTAAHHTFDFETGRTSWLILKGEGGVSIKERIVTETNFRNGSMSSEYGIAIRHFHQPCPPTCYCATSPSKTRDGI